MESDRKINKLMQQVQFFSLLVNRQTQQQPHNHNNIQGDKLKHVSYVGR